MSDTEECLPLSGLVRKRLDESLADRFAGRDRGEALAAITEACNLTIELELETSCDWLSILQSLRDAAYSAQCPHFSSTARDYMHGDCAVCGHTRTAAPQTSEAPAGWRTVQWTEDGELCQEGEECPWLACPGRTDTAFFLTVDRRV